MQVRAIYVTTEFLNYLDRVKNSRIFKTLKASCSLEVASLTSIIINSCNIKINVFQVNDDEKNATSDSYDLQNIT